MPIYTGKFENGRFVRERDAAAGVGVSGRMRASGRSRPAPGLVFQDKAVQERLGDPKTLEDRIFGQGDSGYSSPVRNLKQSTVTIKLDSGGGSFGEEGLGPVNARIMFADREYRSESTSDTVAEIRNRIEGLDKSGLKVTYPLVGADFDIVKEQHGPPTGKAVSIDIYGDEMNVMAMVAGDMKKIMSATEGVAKPTDNASTAQPTLEWRVDLAKAGMLGLNQEMTASALQIAVGGKKVELSAMATTSRT